MLQMSPSPAPLRGRARWGDALTGCPGAVRLVRAGEGPGWPCPPWSGSGHRWACGDAPPPACTSEGPWTPGCALEPRRPLPLGRTSEARHLEGAAHPGCPADRLVRPAGSRPAGDNWGSYRRATGALGALALGSTVRLRFLFTAAPTCSLASALPLLPARCPGPRFLPFTRPLPCVRIRSLLSHPVRSRVARQPFYKVH